jgi:peptide/nickel transport system substrate-binding protein
MSRRASARVRAATALLAAAVVAAGCGSSGAPAGAEDSTLVAYGGQSGDFLINFNPFAPSSIGGVGAIFQPCAPSLGCL